MKPRRALSVILVAGAAIGVSVPLFSQTGPTTGPIARYDIRAGTISGMGAMGRGGMASMLFGGGGNNQQHELLLRLGSSQSPEKGGPKAEHFMPTGAKLGKSVQLTTPKNKSGDVGTDELPEKPKGRLLIFWGCGAHAPKGQPVVIDFSNLKAGEIPPGLWTSTILRDWGPTQQNSKTFGSWPSEDGKYARPDSSLLGAHRIASNYAPEIAFTAAKDFMVPLAVSTAPQTGGATLLSWNRIPDATGYVASLTGGKQGPNGQMGDMVMWTSSSSRQFGGGLSDWLTPAQVAKLVADKTVLPPSATSCVIPAEVKAAAPDFRFGILTGFGPEENFAYPPRPKNADEPWHLQWTVRIRHRSMTNWMEAQGMSMGAEGDASTPTKPPCKRKGGLGGMLGGVLGADGC